MATFPLQEIKDRLNLVDVISGYIKLTRSGTNYKAKCPFHNERTASLMVSPAKQIWHCFGCHEGGDVIGFVERMEHLSFPETVKLLAERVGVTIVNDPEAQKRTEQKNRLFRINEFAGKFYEANLASPKNKPALLYLQQRGLNAKTIKEWGIGFAPATYEELVTALKSKGVSSQDGQSAGVLVEGNRGAFDRFRGRITFPWFNLAGKVIGFSARILTDAPNTAKYVNSPETQIFSKGRELFGIYLAKDSIVKEACAILVEGQMDCISLHQAGFRNVVATSGTALTPEHLRLLSRLTDTVVIMFDSDQAGREAEYKAGMLALASGLKVKSINLQAGKDPDDLAQHNPRLLKELLTQPEWFLDAQIKEVARNFPPGSLEQKHEVSTKLLPLLQKLQDPIDLEHFMEKIAETFRIQITTLKKELDTRTNNISVAEQESPVNVTSGVVDPLELQVLGGILGSPVFRQEVYAHADEEIFSSPVIRELFINFKQGKEGEVLSLPLAQEALFVVESFQEELGGNSALLEQELQKNLLMLRHNKVKRDQIEIGLQMQKAEAEGNKAEIQTLSQTFNRLSSLRVELENKINTNN